MIICCFAIQNGVEDQGDEDEDEVASKLEASMGLGWAKMFRGRSRNAPKRALEQCLDCPPDRTHHHRNWIALDTGVLSYRNKPESDSRSCTHDFGNEREKGAQR